MLVRGDDTASPIGSPWSRVFVQPNGDSRRVMGVDDAAIFSKYQQELVRFATVMVGPDEAEDVVSTVVVRVLRRRALTDLDDPRSYLFQAVVNESKSVWRRRKRVEWLPEGSVIPVDVYPEVVDAVDGLPLRQKAAVYLTYWRDLPLAETAQLLGCSIGAVKRYLYLARRRLKGALGEN